MENRDESRQRMNPFWQDYPALQARLGEVKKIILKQMKTKERYLDRDLQTIFMQEGKMLRPALVLLGAEFGQADPEKAERLAAIVEMLHTATLIHDDIVDDAPVRRNQPTPQSQYGKDFAVYAGDFLFCRCFELLSGEESMEYMRMVSKAMGKICMGELRQYYTKCIDQPSMGNYVRIIGAKTAALFSLSLAVGAYEGGLDKKMQFELGRIGFEIGMAFQIQDDLLDFLPESETGKKRFADLKNHYFTLPILLALKDGNKEVKQLLSSELTQEDCLELHTVLWKKRYMKKAKAIADAFSQKALQRLQKLPDLPCRDILQETIHRMTRRPYGPFAELAVTQQSTCSTSHPRHPQGFFEGRV